MARSVKINARELAKIAHHPQVQERFSRDAEQLARAAAQLAPKDTGEGAASIHAEEQPDGSWRVSWDRAHDYMRFPEFGTESQAPQPFLRPAANRLR